MNVITSSLIKVQKQFSGNITVLAKNSIETAEVYLQEHTCTHIPALRPKSTANQFIGNSPQCKIPNYEFFLKP